MRSLANYYQRTVNLKLLILFSILLLFSWIVSSLIVNSPPSMVILASIAVIIFAVIFFSPLVGLMLLFFVIPFEYIVNFPISIYKIISLVFIISWVARKVITKEWIRFSFKYPQTKYFTALIFALALSLFFSIDKGSSLPFFKRFVLLSLMCVFLVDVISSPRHLRKLAWVIGLSGGLASLVGLMQYKAFNTGVRSIATPWFN